MEDLLNTRFIIKAITIRNFASPLENVSIQITINSEKYGNCNIEFNEVTMISIDKDYYGISDNPSILIEDISNNHWENICYSVEIMEDVMSFYCKSYSIIKD